MMYCFAKLCRLCTKNINITSTLHTTDADEIQLKDKLLSIMPELVPIDEKLPSYVCATCHERLKDAYDFKTQCLQSADVLKGYLAQMNNVITGETQVQQVAEINIQNYEFDLMADIKVESKNVIDISTNLEQEFLSSSNDMVLQEFKRDVYDVDEEFTQTESKLNVTEELNNRTENTNFVKQELGIYNDDTVSLDTDIFKRYEATEKAKQTDACDEDINEILSIKVSDATDTTNWEVEINAHIIEQVKNGTAPKETILNKFNDEEYVNEEDASNLVKEIAEPIFAQVNNNTAVPSDAGEATRETNEHVEEPVVDKENTRQLRKRKASRPVFQSADDDSNDEHEAMDDFDYSSSGSEFQMCSDDASDDCDDPDDGFNMSTTSTSIAPRVKEINRFIASPANCFNNTPTVVTAEVHSSNKMNYLNFVNEKTVSDGILLNSNTVHQVQHIPMEAGSGNDVASSVAATEVRLNNELNHVEEEIYGSPEILRNSNTEVQSEHLHKIAGANLSAVRGSEEPSKFTLQHPIDRFIKNPILKQFYCKTCNIQVCDSNTLTKHLKRHAEVTQAHSNNKIIQFDSVNKVNEASDGVLLNLTTVRQAERIPMEADSGSDVASSAITTEVRSNHKINLSNYVNEKNDVHENSYLNADYKICADEEKNDEVSYNKMFEDNRSVFSWHAQKPKNVRERGNVVASSVTATEFCLINNKMNPSNHVEEEIYVSPDILLNSNTVRQPDATEVHKDRTTQLTHENSNLNEDDKICADEEENDKVSNNKMFEDNSSVFSWRAQNPKTVRQPSSKKSVLRKDTICEGDSSEGWYEDKQVVMHSIKSAIRDPEDPTKFTLQHPIDPDTKYVFIRNTEMQIFICKTCNKVVSSFRILQYHMERHINPKKYVCKICDKRMCDVTRMREHVNNHRKDCNICGMKFTNGKSLCSHMKTNMNEDQTHLQFACKLCEKKYKSKKNLQMHMMTHNKKYCCEYCSALFTHSSALKIHIAHKHNHEKNFICSVCGAAYKKLSSLKNHTLTHDKTHKSIKYECDICNKVFGTIKGFTKHKRYAHTDRTNWKHTCNMCNKKFKDKCLLAIHMLLHTGEKPHVCSHCKKEFRLKIALDNHVRTHTGQRPFVCQVCDRGFTQATSLTVHMRTHTGEKPYKCKECGKCYTQSYVYYQHVKKKHPKTEGSKEAGDEEQDDDQSSS